MRVFISDRTAINTDVLMRVASTIGPKILATCDVGAVEEWIQGRCMTHAEIISPAFMPKLASALRTLHQDAKVCFLCLCSYCHNDRARPLTHSPTHPHPRCVTTTFTS